MNQDTFDQIALRPGQEALSTEEKEAFLRRARAEGRALTSEEMYAIFGPTPEKVPPEKISQEKVESFRKQAEVVEEMEAAWLDATKIAQLQENFFPELGKDGGQPQTAEMPRLLRGVIFDFDDTLAYLSQPLADLMATGARQADAYMRSTNMNLPDPFWDKIVEARRFAEEKSEEEREEHIADDAMTFLLQFFGYPVSKMRPEVLRQAVDIFYAPEMIAWKLHTGALAVLKTLHSQGYKVAVMTHYNCDRVFQRTIDYLGIRPYLDLCVSSASIEYRKPDPTFFQAALDRWDALPYEVVVIGDSLKHDIAGGLELGALTIQMKLGSSPQVEHDNQQLAATIQPDAISAAWDQVPTLIQQWA